MKKLNRTNLGLEKKRPIKVVQFGEGNFLRAFVDYAFQELNRAVDLDAGIAVVQPIENGLIDLLNEQDGLYTLFMRGVSQGQEIQDIALIDAVVKGVNPYEDYNEFLSLACEDSLEFVISNTTEAGIAYVPSDRLDMEPPTSFPAKLTALLFERFRIFNGDPSKGLTIIPCELINHNSETLKEIIYKYIFDWNLGDDFKSWIENHNAFHSTLVDRIVPGYPKADIDAYNAQLDYSDNLIVTAEAFFLWVIEGGDQLRAKLPFEKTHLDVKIVDDMQPYRTRKVRILNGAHTAMVPFSLLYGNTTVKQTVDHEFTGTFVQDAVFNEIIDTLDMDRSELKLFAEEIFDRFRNPFIVHNLSSIALNSISKFKVRVLPSLLGYVETHGKLPVNLTFAFACLLRFYKGTWNGEDLTINDDKAIVDRFEQIWSSNDHAAIAKEVLGIEAYWGEDLNEVAGLTKAIDIALSALEKSGVEAGYEAYKNQL